jgi:putative transposase
MNYIESSFEILMKKVIRGGSFKSKEELKLRLLTYIEYFNERMAKPFKWKNQEKHGLIVSATYLMLY